jgi:hypothetical protein
MHYILRKFTAVVILAAVASAAQAQMGGGMRRGGGPGGDGDRGRPDASMPGEGAPQMGANDQVQVQLNRVSAALRLAPEQATGWQLYENKVVALLEDLQRGTTQPQGVDALKQIDARVDVVRNRLTALEDISDAAKKLYAALNAEQKSVADRMLAGTVPALYLYSPMGMAPRAPGRSGKAERRG